MFEGECLIRKAGYGEDDQLGIELKDPGGSFDYTWFNAKAGLRREYLTIALTAITSNRRVFCKMPNSPVANSEIVYFGLVKE